MSNHKVGFGKPPKHTQFQPGKSGNPKGRPKGRVPTTQLLEQYLNAKITVTVGGKQKTISRREALIISLVSDALKGKDKVRKQVFDLLLVLEAKMSPQTLDSVNGVQDKAVINSLLQRYGIGASQTAFPSSLPKAPVKIKIAKAKKNEVVI